MSYQMAHGEVPRGRRDRTQACFPTADVFCVPDPLWRVAPAQAANRADPQPRDVCSKTSSRDPDSLACLSPCQLLAQHARRPLGRAETAKSTRFGPSQAYLVLGPSTSRNQALVCNEKAHITYHEHTLARQHIPLGILWLHQHYPVRTTLPDTFSYFLN